MSGINWPHGDGVVVNRKDAALWWESRRFSFNTYVGLIGAASLLLALFCGSMVVGPGQDFEEPMSGVSGAIIFGILANIFYTGGELLDVLFMIGDRRERLYKAALWFWTVLAALPGVWTLVSIIIVFVTGKQFDE